MATAQLTPAGVGIHNVLIATDFSHHSDIALQFGLSLAKVYGAQAEIVYVLPTDGYVIAGRKGYMLLKKPPDAIYSSLSLACNTRGTSMRAKTFMSACWRDL